MEGQDLSLGRIRSLLAVLGTQGTACGVTQGRKMLLAPSPSLSMSRRVLRGGKWLLTPPRAGYEVLRPLRALARNESTAQELPGGSGRVTQPGQHLSLPGAQRRAQPSPDTASGDGIVPGLGNGHSLTLLLSSTNSLCAFAAPASSDVKQTLTALQRKKTR